MCSEGLEGVFSDFKARAFETAPESSKGQRQAYISGKAAVDWFLKNTPAETRESARLLGEIFLQKGYLESVKTGPFFSDSEKEKYTCVDDQLDPLKININCWNFAGSGT